MVGETVKIELSSADATTAAAVSIYDTNMGVRTLAANERLILDTVAATVTGTNVTVLDLITDVDADGAVDPGERIANFTVGSDERVFGDEGIDCKLGTVPKVKANAAGAFVLIGVGRIINGKSSGVRPTWRGREQGQ